MGVELGVPESAKNILSAVRESTAQHWNDPYDLVRGRVCVRFTPQVFTAHFLRRALTIENKTKTERGKQEARARSIFLDNFGQRSNFN